MTASPANRLSLDYAAEAKTFLEHPYSIVDVHTHINGHSAPEVYQKAARLYGVGLTYSMTQLEQVDRVREILGDSIRFITFPNFMGEDRAYEHSTGYLKRIEQFHEKGVRIAKFWAAPRGIDFGEPAGRPDLFQLNAPHRLEAIKLATDLGMVIMTHVSDPNTWFETKYKDSARYGTKLDQYAPLEELLAQFNQPWIAAHMGGWPEDLEFLSGLLERHDNLHLDTSATKWMVRELSKHSAQDLLSFLERWKGRILFGSDIVSSDEHLSHSQSDSPHSTQAESKDQAFDLYASRYWALRKLFETDYDGESPIADPDLAMVNPDKFGPNDAPHLSGKALPNEILRTLYSDAARTLLDPYHSS